MKHISAGTLSPLYGIIVQEFKEINLAIDQDTNERNIIMIHLI